MTAGLKIFEHAAEGVLSRRTAEEWEKMERNAAAAAERLGAKGPFVTEMQDIRDRAGPRESSPA